MSQSCDNGPTCGVGEGGKCVIEVFSIIFNHVVKYRDYETRSQCIFLTYLEVAFAQQWTEKRGSLSFMKPGYARKS